MMVPNPSRVISSMDQGSDEDEISVVAFAAAFVFTAAAAAAADCSSYHHNSGDQGVHGAAIRYEDGLRCAGSAGFLATGLKRKAA